MNQNNKIAAQAPVRKSLPKMRALTNSDWSNKLGGAGQPETMQARTCPIKSEGCPGPHRTVPCAG